MISKLKLKKSILLLVVVIAGLSTVLRPSIDSSLTLFRVILPILMAYMALKRPRQFFIFLITSLFLTAYSIFISLYMSRYNSFDVVFILYYIIILFLFIYVEYVNDIVGTENVYQFLKYLFFSFLILGYIQLYFGGNYPNTNDRGYAVNIFFWNENEFSATLGILLLIFFLKEKKTIITYIVMLLAFHLILYNGARLVVIAISLFIFSYYYFKIPLFRIKYLGLTSIVLLLFSLALYTRDIEVFEQTTVQELVFYPFEHLINLDPVINIGSINGRLNAVIFGTLELKDSYFLGIGPGNSVKMMFSKVDIGQGRFAAYSMHNFIYQIITELGILGLVLLFLMGRFVIKNIRKNTVYPRIVIVFFYICFTILISILSGSFSNYFCIFMFYYSIYFFRDNITTM